MFLTRLGQTWLFYHNIIPYHDPFLSYVVLLRYLRWNFIPSPYKHTFITLLFFIKMQLSLLSGRIFLPLKQNILPVISFSESHFSRVFRKKITFYYIRNIPAALEGLYFFRLDNMFYLVSFLLTCMIFRVLGKHLLLRQRNMFYHFLCFREIAFARLHIYYLRVFRLNYVFAV